MSRQADDNRRPAVDDATAAVHLLSFDVEEYFHVEAAARGVRRDRWDSYPKRLQPRVERILQLLAEHDASATFFVLGWVARHERRVVRQIAEAGYEIASHGMTHQMIVRLTPQQFRDELADSRKVLQDLSGQPVIGYRAPTFSVTRRTAWAIDALAESGYRYDSSVFPVRHDRYGVPDAPRDPHRAVGPGGGSVIEIPPLTLRAVHTNWPVGGGGYLRLFPIALLGRALRLAARRGRPGMVYLHPWEFDPGQPILPMSRLSRFRHRVGLRRTERKLAWLLKRFRFGEVRGVLPAIQANGLASHTYAA